MNHKGKKREKKTLARRRLQVVVPTAVGDVLDELVAAGVVSSTGAALTAALVHWFHDVARAGDLSAEQRRRLGAPWPLRRRRRGSRG